MSEAVVKLQGLQRRFGTSGPVQVLEDVNLELQPAERVAVMGSSGSGKTTLLHLAAGMDTPDAGTVEVGGLQFSALQEPERTRFRAQYIGLVFQDFNLIDSLTVRENIELPLWLNNRLNQRERIGQLAEELGISKLLDRLPEKLSGGEKQRVAIARALVHEPALLLADEPTGSLDQTTAEGVLRLFDRVTRQHGVTLLMVTHNDEAAALCDRVLHLRHGKLSDS
ncbi:MAG: ABC transporter ATP-binding protein [Wenzhouxiangella sp.]|jgi:putative ABC transport system ATP-binding protein|nr:ABC transporter ATP-binding protein [Wenzhouxiangella sp.]